MSNYSLVVPAVLLLSVACLSQAAVNDWPREAKVAYVDRCAKSLASQGWSPSPARNYCSCIADGMENEFGVKEYNQMMNAQPNPKGNEYDQRLYRVFSACSGYLSR
jgi:hypothetical protein